MAVIGNPQYKSGANYLQVIEPSDIPNLWWWMDAGSFSGSTWTDKSNNGYNATVTGTAWTTTTTTGNGATASIPVIYGLSTSQAVWPAGSIPANYTFFHVARYANYADHAKSGRIWTSTDGTTGNWLSGFWYGSGSAGVSGVAYHNNWTVSPQTNLHSDNWVLSTDQPSLYRSNGVTRGTGAFGAGYPNGTGQLKINYNGFELSDFYIAEAIMFNRILTAQEYLMVEQYLSQKYGIPLPSTTPKIIGKDPYSEYVTSLVRFDGANGATSITDDALLKSPTGQMYNPTYNASLSTSQVIKGTASGNFSSNNGSSAYGGFRVSSNSATKLDAPQILDVSRDFTVEGWIYFPSSLPSSADMYWFMSDTTANFNNVNIGNGFRVGKRTDHTLIWYFDNGTDVGGPTSGAGAVKFALADTWYHWAVVKKSNVMRTYINGIASSTTTSVGARTHSNSYTWMTLGNDFAKNGYPCYLDDVRITNGVARYDSTNFQPDRSSYWPVPSDQYWPYVVTHLRYEGSSVVDRSPAGLSWTASTTSAFGGEYFSNDPGNGFQGDTGSVKYVTVASTSSFAFGTGDFTVDMWVYFNTLNNASEQNIIDFRTTTSTVSPNIVFNTSNQPVYRTGTTARITGTAISTIGWRHVALSRVNGTTRLFVDGALQGTAYTDASDYAASPCTALGRHSDKTLGFGGNISCLRITKGVGRYAAAFTHPSAPPPIG